MAFRRLGRDRVPADNQSERRGFAARAVGPPAGCRGSSAVGAKGRDGEMKRGGKAPSEQN